MACDTTDFQYPLLADIYYPIVGQSAYGDVNKRWVYDRTVACGFAPMGRARKPGVQVSVEILIDSMLVGRTRCDIRTTVDGVENAITNVLLTNIRDSLGNEIYLETSGVRQGKSTLFEIAGNEPIVGPFGSLEYYRVIIRRSENQGADI